MNRRKLFGYLLLLCLGTLFPVQGQVYILVDVTNDVAMAKNNDIHIAGFEGLEAISKKILHYQTWIAGFTTRLVEREEERITSLLEVDDLYGDNQQWKDNFVARLDTLEQNLEVIRQMIDSYPKTSKLQKNYERLVEDLEDTEKKYNMVSEGGQSNMMRNAERNHLALLAEDQLDEIAWQIQKLYWTIPGARNPLMNESIPQSLLPVLGF